MLIVLKVWTYVISIVGVLYALVGSLLVVEVGLSAGGSAVAPLRSVGPMIMSIATFVFLRKLGPIWRWIERWVSRAEGERERVLRGLAALWFAPAVASGAVTLALVLSVALGSNSWASAFGLP